MNLFIVIFVIALIAKIISKVRSDQKYAEKHNLLSSNHDDEDFNDSLEDIGFNSDTARLPYGVGVSIFHSDK